MMVIFTYAHLIRITIRDIQNLRIKCGRIYFQHHFTSSL
ncbi:hypothetical protein LM500008_260421 [Listeria monocytogenes]|nr:hypothetical protein LM500008_260421 [Listeria monocytogenes]CUK46454.1 hypothetical protein LM500190_270397 [Listeria monocytogenes]CUK58431.1 hypothetical protein LM600918_10158 [Listeria monocytogenes]CUK72439.1 hypothetical protein LM601023_30036 [Listeria monocytogenes]CUK88132.1 hypothetical protein LM700596_250421 [Listeria monocytogenes]